jgi:hypothetical protein
VRNCHTASQPTRPISLVGLCTHCTACPPVSSFASGIVPASRAQIWQARTMQDAIEHERLLATVDTQRRHIQELRAQLEDTLVRVWGGGGGRAVQAPRRAGGGGGAPGGGGGGGGAPRAVQAPLGQLATCAARCHGRQQLRTLVHHRPLPLKSGGQEAAAAAAGAGLPGAPAGARAAGARCCR